jgi:glycosyltransferase involved in cell wall biosynthesis
MGTNTRGLKGVCLFGGHHAGYPRSAVLLEGLRRLGVPVTACVASPRRKAPRRYAELAACYARLRDPFDVLFVPEFRHKDVPLAALLARAGGKLCVFDPLVSRYDTRVHDRRDVDEVGAQAWHNRNLDRVSMSLADLVLADTEAHAAYYRRHLAPPDARVRVLEVGYDDAVFRPTEEPGGGTVRVLFFGSYLPLHGVDVIVEAARLLAARSDIEFELIGGGQTYADAAARVRAHALGGVRLVERLPADELAPRIQRAHVCLGIFGGTAKAARVIPNKVFQSMGAARVTVTADTAATRATFADGEEIVLVPAGDPAALAATIEGLADDPARRRSIARAGARRVARDFSPVPLATRFVGYCREAMQ